MSAKEYLEERDKIDFLLQKGYRIQMVSENLSGAFVTFELTNEGEKMTETLHIQNADARKYFSSMLMKERSIN